VNYLKFSANYLFTGTQMLTGHQHVLVVKPNGTIEAIVPKNEAGEGVQTLNGLLCPGFINAHCHLELSHMLGKLPQHGGLVNFLLDVIQQRNAPDEQIAAAIKAADEQMYQNGIVAVGDICNTTATLTQKAVSALQYYNFIEVSGWLPQFAADRLMAARQTYHPFAEPKALVPHAPYSVSAALWNLLELDFAGKTISIHNQEAAAENEFFLSGKGQFLELYKQLNLDTSFYNSPGTHSLPYYTPYLAAAQHVLLVHNTFTSSADIVKVQEQIKNNQVFWCICANANLYIENVLPNLPQLLEQNCQLVLGTDSLASNHSLNMIAEMATLQKAFPEIDTSIWLQAATFNGATALQMQNQLGSFTKGKTPGLVWVQTKQELNFAEATIQRLL
jgi:aminodeoxyfutalosine deaminase